MAKRRTSLRTFLVVPAVLFVIIALSVSWYQRDAAADEARRTALADARFAAVVAADDLGSGIQRAADRMAATAATPAVGAVFASPEACALNYSVAPPLSSGHLDIVAADGTVVCSSSKAGAGASYAGATWLQAGLVGPIVQAFVADERTGRSSLVIGSPIDTRGVLVTFVDLATIGPGLAASFRGPRDLEFVVVTTDKRIVVTRSIDARKWVGKRLSGERLGVGGKSQGRDLDGASRFYGSADVATAPWQVLAGASTSQALKAANEMSNQQVVAIAVALTVALIILWFLYRGLARPIANLRDGVREATDDPYTEPIHVAGPLEVAQLASNFNQLIAAARRERELEQRLRRAERADEHERELRLLEDRERIGGELHDTVIQHLFATGMSLQSVVNRIADEDARARVTSAVDDIDSTIREVRSAIFEMEKVGVATPTEMLRDVVAEVGEGLGLQPSIAFVGPVDTAVPGHVADQMAAALRESLTNAARHASARVVDVAVNVGDDIVLTVRDDGVGIDARAADRGGLGLASLRARAERLGGEFSVERVPAGGTKVEWRVPRGASPPH